MNPYWWYYGVMAARKMTFSIPEDIAGEFVRSVAARDRSRYIAEMLSRELKAQHDQLARACDIANADPDVLAIEREFDAISEDIPEAWNGAASR